MTTILTSTQEQSIRQHLALMKFCADSVNLSKTIEHYELLLAEIDHLRRLREYDSTEILRLQSELLGR